MRFLALREKSAGQEAHGTLVQCLVLVLAGNLSLAAQQHWVATWGTAQQQYRAGRGGAPVTSAAPPQVLNPTAPARRFPVPPPLVGLHNQTVRMIVRSSIGGNTLRVRLSHALGASMLSLGAAHLALHGKDSGIVQGSDRALTFGGKPSATLYGGQVLISDPVTLDVAPLTDLAVSLYFPGETGPPTSHTFGLRPTYISGEGDFTGRPEIPDADGTDQSWYWLTGIDVLAPRDAFTVVTFGDSITDGDQSTPDTNNAWPSLLARRLGANRIGIVNAGISGNRILGDNNGGLARLLRDAITVPGVRWLTLLEGINDINGAMRANTAFSADDLISAYRQVIETAHLYGLKIAGCTLTPYEGSSAFTEKGEAIRQAANRWIRTSGAFDAVFDFDAATRDPKTPGRFRPEADSPDLPHPGDAGYKLMADSIDVRVFRK
jgi:lysophospholipase L1-like esterase